MRKNVLVTDIETKLPEGEFIYSRTDLKSYITEANEAFAKISGYEREDMLGQPHNIVRHPDMPEEAFADLWADLKAGRPWRGLVKNRRSDGGFYWVTANASPVREGGRIVGYQSIRTCPSREEVAVAEAAYKRIRAGDQSLKIQHGRVVKKRNGFLSRLGSFDCQLTIMGGLAILLSCLALAASFSGVSALAVVVDIVAALTGLYSLLFLLWVAPGMRRHLQAIADHMEYVLTSGDLTRRFSLQRKDIIGGISRRFDVLTSSLQATMQCIDDASSQVTTLTKEVTASVHKVKTSASVQGEATQAAAATVEEVTAAIGEVASHAVATHEASMRSGEAAREGADQSGQASTTVEKLAQTIEATAQQIEGLGKRSEEISRVTGLIRGIAEQTNLLALNAAIEAARAGDTGRGFAVVADEVRKLAERTGKATEDISEMIAAIADQTGNAVTGMQAGGAQVQSGVAMVQQARNTLDGINVEMRKTMDMVSEISHATVEQQNAMAELSGNINRVTEMTEQNIAVVNYTDQLAQKLNDSVHRMGSAVSQYAA